MALYAWVRGGMLYLAVLALVGLVCASAFRWPVMLICAFFVGSATLVLALWGGEGVLGGALRAAGAVAVLQVAYVTGGIVASVRLRGVGAKRNIRA